MLKLVHSLLKFTRGSIAYLGFTATLFSGFALLLQRDWIDASLLYLEELIGPFGEVIEYARSIALHWHGLIVQPIARGLYNQFSIQLPIWIVEIMTLTVFAAGPILRMIWTRRALAREVKIRREKYSNLCQLIEVQTREIAELKRTRLGLEKALKEKNLDRAKSIGGMLSSATLALLSIAGGSAPTAGHQARAAQVSFNAFKDSFSNLKNVEENIRRLSDLTETKLSDVEILEQRALKLEMEENGLLKRLLEVDTMEVDKFIASHVEQRMRISLILSRASLAIAACVVGSYAIEFLI